MLLQFEFSEILFSMIITIRFRFFHRSDREFHLRFQVFPRRFQLAVSECIFPETIYLFTIYDKWFVSVTFQGIGNSVARL